MLILPFVPLNRTNAIAWLAARSDGDNYGKLVSFRFPSSVSVPGPTQVERRIDSDGRVSQQLTLWNQSGSKVIRGNLLMIPIGNANLFFEPLYLSAHRRQRAAAAQARRRRQRRQHRHGADAARARSTCIFGRAAPSGLDSSGASVGSPTATPAQRTARSDASHAAASSYGSRPWRGDVASLVAQALESYNRAQTLLRNGDFAGYGAEIERSKQILDRLQQLVGTPVATP